jgi:transposase InsO family protein
LRKKIKVLHSDNGTKYINRAMHCFLRDNSIIHQTTCVSTPEHNGVTERKNRHILEVTRCLLFAMNVPKYLWGEAVHTATYLINRMSLRTVDVCVLFVSPKKFGCVCFVHNTSSGISKLDVKSHKCVFVGYSSGKKRYKCYDPVKKRMFESLDVTFRETESYFVLSNAQSNTSHVSF